MHSHPADDTVRFIERFLGLLDQGRFVATYKYAVLLGLIDLSLERTLRDGTPPTSVTTTMLAEKVIDLYWPQSIPFRGKAELQQSPGQQARILRLITAFRSTLKPTATSTHAARLFDPHGYTKLVREVEWTLVQMPLPKLQRVGSESLDFIYAISWSDDITRGEYRDPHTFQNTIRFQPGAAENLVRLASVLRPLVQRNWSDHVASMNRDLVPKTELDHFLFGSTRQALTQFAPPLRDLQHGLCFYCTGKLSPSAEVDHFIPWSRYANDGLCNLVLAHPRCNSDKKAFLAATVHVESWATRTVEHQSEIQEISQALGKPANLESTIGVVRGTYLNLPSDVKLWLTGKEFESGEPGQLADAMSALAEMS